MSAKIEEIRAENGRELLEILRPSSERWGGGGRSPWIFRGQWDAAWDLVPSAWNERGHGRFSVLYDEIRQIVSVDEECLRFFHGEQWLDQIEGIKWVTQH